MFVFLLQGEKTRRRKCKMHRNVLVGLPGNQAEIHVNIILWYKVAKIKTIFFKC